jgi:predicted dehydrogenase
VPTLGELNQAVQGVLASKRLGTPLFVRLHLQGLSEAGSATLVGDWIGRLPLKRFPLSSTGGRTRQTTAVLQFSDGATALVSEVHGQTPERGACLTILGSKGAVYHDLDSGSWPEWEQAAPPHPPRRSVKARYGVLLVTGSHTHQEDYAAAFAADPRCKIVAVTDEKDVGRRRRRLNEQLAHELHVPHEPDLDRALAQPEVQIVSVCAPPERRARIILRCVREGKHLYLDKPLAPRLDEVDVLTPAVGKAAVCSHMFSFITQPWAAEAKRLLASGKLGSLLAIHADVFFAKGRQGTAKLGSPRREQYPPERQQLVQAKRELDNIGVYPVTLLPWLTGKQFRTVYGVTGNYFFRQHQKRDVEDFGLLACTLEDGLPVSIAVGRCGWTSHPAGGVNRLLLVGSERTAVIDANRPRLEVYTDESPWRPPAVNRDDPMGFWTSTQAAVDLQPKRTWLPLRPAGASDVSYFLDRLDAGQDSEMSVAAAAHAAEVVLAGYRSASTGEAVTLPLPR